MSAPRKQGEEDPRIQLINMAFNGATSCSGIVVSVLLFIVGCVFGIPGFGILLGMIGLPPALSLLVPFIIVPLFWWCDAKKK